MEYSADKEPHWRFKKPFIVLVILAILVLLGMAGCFAYNQLFKAKKQMTRLKCQLQ